MFEFLDVYPWLLPIIIFFGRICDVTLGTLRIIFISKGERRIAPIVGFVEVLIWVVIISQIFSHANSPIAYLAYAGGYACGNFIGISLESKIAFGYVLLRIYTKKDGVQLVKALNQNDFGSTYIKGKGVFSDVGIIESVIRRKAQQTVTTIIHEFDPEAFYLIEDIRSKRKGIFSSVSIAGHPRQGK